MKKQYISKEDLAKACTLDLFTYFKHYYPDELVKKSRNVYVTKMHDSLNIKTNGLWYWWSHGIGGRSAFKYLRDVEGMDWQVAASYLLRLMDEIPVSEVKHIESKRKFVLPKKNQNENFIKEYLVNQRYINEDLVESCIMKNLIYEDQKTHAVVFVGYDVNYYPKFACMRSTDSKWKKDCLGSDKRYSFSIHNEKSTNLHVFESAIDLLSFMTILKMKGEEIWNQNYLSIDGATGLGTDINDGNIPVALDYFLRNNEIRNIYLHLDNDEAGKNTTTKIKHVLKKKYKIYDRTPKHGKDVNDELIHYIQKEKEMKKEELTQKQIEQIKEMYPSGTKVECIRMDDPYHAIPSGMMGIVDHVDDTGTIHMQWANGSSLGLIPGEDLFRIIKSPIKKKGLER